MSGPTPFPDPSVDGPLDRTTALALLERADELLDQGELRDAIRHYQRVVGHTDPAVTATALLGIGTAAFRADDEAAAIAAWRAVLELPETPGTYLAYRHLAAEYVREGRLREAIDAYRQADRRAPAEDRPEIAARLGWLTKEVGDERGAGRYFARSRGSGAATTRMTYAIILVTSIVSLVASFDPALYESLRLDKIAVADGEYQRLVTVALVHLRIFQSPLHLLFNMYAVWFAGGLVERIYGGRRMLAMYVIAAAVGAAASFAFGDDIPSVGASGAVFGLFGILIAAARAHDPVVDRQGQAIIGQIGFLVALNLVLGFVLPGIDWLGHVGGLVAGLWLGFLLVPGRVPTRRRWAVGGASEALSGASGTIGALAYLGAIALVVAGVVVGTVARL